MTKKDAVKTIIYAANERMEGELKYSEYMQHELNTELKYGLGIEDAEKIAGYELVDYSNGFYLGQIKDGKRDGYGTYLWYATEDEDICFYSGYWKDGDFNGDGFWGQSNSQS